MNASFAEPKSGSLSHPISKNSLIASENSSRYFSFHCYRKMIPSMAMTLILSLSSEPGTSFLEICYRITKHTHKSSRASAEMNGSPPIEVIVSAANPEMLHRSQHPSVAVAEMQPALKSSSVIS
jgi:hypothetical protein